MSVLAAHQPSFLPWLSFFRKMILSDKFCILGNVQFEKNSFLNRAKVREKWWTVPVEHGLSPIYAKRYVNGSELFQTNMKLITGFMGVFGIPEEKLVFDYPFEGCGTDRLISICKRYGCNEYLTNPEAEEKYLDVNLMETEGIKVVPFIQSSDYKTSLFEAFEKWGVEGTRKMLWKH